MFGLRLVSLIALLWTLFVFTRASKRFRILPHSQTFILMVFQLFADVGGTTSYAFDNYNISLKWSKYILYLIRSIGNYGTRINTALIGLSLFMITNCNSQFVFKSTVYIQTMGVLTPIVFSAIVLAVKQDDIYDHYIASIGFKEEPIVALTVLVLCVLITMISIIIAQRQYKKSKLCENKEQAEFSHRNTTKKLHFLPIPEEILHVNFTRYEWKENKLIYRGKAGLFHLYNHDCQILRHTLLLICLLVSMFIGK